MFAVRKGLECVNHERDGKQYYLEKKLFEKDVIPDSSLGKMPTLH